MNKLTSFQLVVFVQLIFFYADWEICSSVIKTCHPKVCIVQHESTYNTAAIGPPNSDGSTDHGLFQINDRYWCSPPGSGKGCGVSCAQLRHDNIEMAVSCAWKIFQETQRLRGDGFTAWSVYRRYCDNGRAKKYTAGCGV